MASWSNPCKITRRDMVCNDARDYHCHRIHLLYTRVTFCMIYYYTNKRRNREPSVSILSLYAITLIQRYMVSEVGY